MLERQTNLTLEQLREMTKNLSGRCSGSFGCGGLAEGQILNEIGTIFVQGDREAEKDLVDMLRKGKMESSIGYFYLLYSGRKSLSQEAKEALGVYEKDPANKDMIKFVLKKIAERKKEERLSE